jgi:prepilin-type N-terminal cleavage/methylation domain-containing protein
MFKKLKRQSNDGFTIIEVLIVLAIAALILLIVFLAVPALQRSARNTQRKNDAAAVGGALANFISNNGGAIPDQVAGDGTNTNNVVLSKMMGTMNTETAKVGYYTVNSSGTGAVNSGNVTIINTTAGMNTPMVTTPGTMPDGAGATITTDQLIIVTGEACDSTGTMGGQANPRTAAIFYVTESGSGNGSEQCIEQ